MQFDAILREKIGRKPLRISFSALWASIAIMASMTSHYEILAQHQNVKSKNKIFCEKKFNLMQY